MGVVVRQALLIAVKDTRVFFKDKFAVGFSFLFPFLFVIGFSLALSGQGPGDDALELVVATQETQDGLSHAIIEGLTQGEQGVIPMHYETALADVESGQLDGFVSFPADFSERLFADAPATIEVVTASGSSPGRRAALRGLANSATTGPWDSVALQPLLESLPEDTNVDDGSVFFQGPSVVTFEVERVGDIAPRNMSNFTLPAYLTMFVFFAAAMSAEAIARERQTNTLERLLSNGTRRCAIILGKFSGTAFRGLLQLAVMWVVGIFAFGIYLGVSPVAVIIISVLMALASAAFGVMLASFVSNVRTASTASVLVSLTLAPIGGCWWPLFITPEWMQSLGKLTPHGWANTGFNKLMLFGAQFADVTQEMTMLVLFGVAFLAIALWRFRLSAA